MITGRLKSGRSSGIQSPESGTVTLVTFIANDCKELNAQVSGRSPPKAGYMSPPHANTGIVILVLDDSLFCSASTVLLYYTW